MKTNWQTKKLGVLCRIELGKTPYRGNHKFWDVEKQTNNVWLSISDLLTTEENIVFDSKEYISNEGAELCKIVKKGTLLVSFKLTLGRLAFAGKDLYTNEAIAALTIKDDKQISKNYLYYYLSFFDWHGAVKGDIKIKGKTLNKSKLNEIDVFYPESLPEQHRIVKILDEVFAQAANAKENAEKNLQNAKELFESCLQGVFENRGEGWETKEFGEIIEILTDYHANGSYKALKANVELKENEDYAWMVRSTDFENNFKNDKRYISKDSYEFLRKSKVFGNEIIISKIGNAGKIYLMPRIDRPCSLAMNLFLMRVNETKYFSQYVYYYLCSVEGQRQIESRIFGTATKTITKDNVRSILIPSPSLKEQKSIVTRLDALSAEAKKLEAVYQQKLADLEELKKSVLKRAFSGGMIKKWRRTDNY
jgi:type I restriction enzyme S subunit